MHRAIASIACCGIPELFTGFFLRDKFSNFPPVQYEIFKVRLVCAQGRGSMADLLSDVGLFDTGTGYAILPGKLKKWKCRHLSSNRFSVSAYFYFIVCQYCTKSNWSCQGKYKLKIQGSEKGKTVTIVKKKVIAPQQFFLQNQFTWYSLSFLWIRAGLTVTILVEKLK